jgi:hypothetical protein
MQCSMTVAGVSRFHMVTGESVRLLNRLALDALCEPYHLPGLIRVGILYVGILIAMS